MSKTKKDTRRSEVSMMVVLVFVEYNILNIKYFKAIFYLELNLEVHRMT